jgi:uncharacterized protein (TIRG00374 family)
MTLPATDSAKKGLPLSLIARIAVATLAILWVFHGQDWKELAQLFYQLNPAYFLLSLGVFVVGQVIIAIRWWVLLRAQTIHIGLLATLRLHFLGLFYNNVMPGSVGGDLLKAWYVTKHTHRRLEGALSVLVDRVIGLSGLLIMGTGAYLLFVRGRLAQTAVSEPGQGLGERLTEHRTAILCVLAVAAVASVAALAHRRTRRSVGHLMSRVRQRAAAWFERARKAIIVYCSKPVTVLVALLLTFLAQSTVVVAFWLLGRNLAIEAEARHYFVIFPVMWVVAAVPISVAGLGVFEAGLVEMFVRLTGTADEKALALAFCQRFVWILASLPGWIIHLLGAHLPRDIFVDSENSLN